MTVKYNNVNIFAYIKNFYTTRHDVSLKCRRENLLDRAPESVKNISFLQLGVRFMSIKHRKNMCGCVQKKLHIICN